MMVEVGDLGVQSQELLSAFPSSEPLLTAFLSPCESVFLLNDVVTPGRGNHLLMIDVRQTRDLPDCGPVTSQLIGMNDLWNVAFSQQPGEEGLRSFGIPMPLKENVEHEAVLVDRSPEPVANAIDARTDLVQMPPGTPTGFPVAQVFSEEGAEFNTPLAQGFVTDLNAALVEQFLDIPVAQREAVIEPDDVLDDAHRKSVAVGFRVGHGGSAYLSPVKATQPMEHPCSGTKIFSPSRPGPLTTRSVPELWPAAPRNTGTVTTFQELGLDFPLFDGSVEDSSEYIGEGTCTLCQLPKAHCFELGIGDDVILACPACQAPHAPDADDQEDGPCSACSAVNPFPATEGSVNACFDCLREGKAALTHDTELGMVR